MRYRKRLTTANTAVGDASALHCTGMAQRRTVVRRSADRWRWRRLVVSRFVRWRKTPDAAVHPRGPRSPCSRVTVTQSVRTSTVVASRRRRLARGGSVAEWLACWSQPRRCLRQTVHTNRVSVHQSAKLAAALLRGARVTVGLAESNGSLPPGL